MTPVRKSATGLVADRPKAFGHFGSMKVQKVLPELQEIRLMGDIVTHGAAAMSAANKLAAVSSRKAKF